MDGAQKSAILMLMLGQEDASKIIKFLSPKEVQKLGEAMAGLKSVLHEQMESVVHELHDQVQGLVTMPVDSDEFIRTVLTQALGDDKASSVLSRILGRSNDISGIESLKWMDAASVAELASQEHPQVIATILVHLDRSHASEILSYLPERIRNDVILRVATLESIQPVALRELNDVMTKLMTSGGGIAKSKKGGAKAVAEILNFASGEMENSVIAHLKAYSENLAQTVVDQMFVFENFLNVDDRNLQTIIREVSSETLVVALKGASDDLRTKFFKNMSQRAAQSVRDDLESLGPVRLTDVEEKQREILKLARMLADEGRITINRGAEETYV
ncbi:MAG: flagellar motor switch protein FliG [Proteobacteria bacterium]|nr:flagellar motor switch protein FliG [Pseudomonadota bacterium]